MSFAVVAHRKSHADGEDGDVVRGLDLLGDLVKGELAEGIHAGGDQDDVLASFDLVDPVQRVIEGVKQIGFGESWNAQLIQRAVDRLLVLGEVGQDMRLHVVGNHRHPVILLEGIGESVAGVQGVHHEVVIGGGKFNQQHGRDRRLRNIEVNHRLLDTVLHHPEVVFLQAGDELPVLGGDQNIHIHQRDVRP